MTSAQKQKTAVAEACAKLMGVSIDKSQAATVKRRADGSWRIGWLETSKDFDGVRHWEITMQEVPK